MLNVLYIYSLLVGILSLASNLLTCLWPTYIYLNVLKLHRIGVIIMLDWGLVMTRDFWVWEYRFNIYWYIKCVLWKLRASVFINHFHYRNILITLYRILYYLWAVLLIDWRYIWRYWFLLAEHDLKLQFCIYKPIEEISSVSLAIWDQ